MLSWKNTREKIFAFTFDSVINEKFKKNHISRSIHDVIPNSIEGIIIKNIS